MVLAGFGLFGVSTWAHAAPSQPNGEWREEIEEFQVQALGGPIRVLRDYVFDRWQLNARWAPLKFTYDNLDGSVKTIERNSAVFLPQGDGWAFERRAVIRKATVSVLSPGQGEGTAPASLDGASPAETQAGGLAVTAVAGYRWQDRSGHWIDYDASGRLVSYGDKNDVRVWLDYGPETGSRQVQKVRDHFGRTVLAVTWANDQVVAVGEPGEGGRRVAYVWNGDLLTQASDVAGQVTRFGYAGKRLASVTDPLGRVRQLAYGPTGRLDSVTEPDGAVTRYVYDYDKLKRVFYVRTTHPATAAGVASEETWYDADGRVTRRDVNGVTQASLLVDTGGRIQTARDAGGRQTVTTRDEFDNVVRTDYPDGSVTSAKYSPAHGGITEAVDELGVKTLYGYDSIGNLLRLTEAAGLAEERITTYTVDAFGQRLSVTRPGDATTRFTYDSFGNLTQLTDAEGGVTRLTHDRAGQPLTLTNARGGVWSRRLDARGQVIAETNPLGATVTRTYDAGGALQQQTDPLGGLTAWRYDAVGRLVAVTDALGGVWKQSYDARGHRVDSRDATDRIEVHRDYDKSGRLLRLTDGAGNVLGLTYGNPLPYPTELQYPTFQQQLGYDARDRVTATSELLGAQTTSTARTVYDRKGQAIELLDRLGRRTTQTWDALGRLTQITDSQGGVTTFRYDGRDNLLAVTDATGAVHRYAYDRLDRRVTETRPLGQTLSRGYDAVGNLIESTDAVGHVIRYTYDAANRRIKEERLPGGQSAPTRIIDTPVDAAGRPTGYTDTRAGQVVSAATYGLDALGRKTTETLTLGGATHTLGRTYAANGQPTRRTYPDGSTVDYGYDDGGRLSTVSTGDGVLTYGAFTWTRPTSLTLPGGGRQTRTVDPLLRLTGLAQTGPTQQPLFDLALTWDAQSNVTRKTVAGQPTDYTYDGLDRLVRAAAPGTSEAWTYDAVGNRLSDAATGSSAWTYNGNHELSARPNRAGQTLEFSHDANGSRTQSRNASDPTAPSAENLSAVYDEANRLVEVKEISGARIASYNYDPFGRRIGKTVYQTLGADGRYRTLAAPQSTGFLYGDEGLLAETDGAGNVTVVYGWRPDGPWGTDPLFRRAGTQTAWYVNDHLGTPQRLVTADGTVVWAGTGSAFGETTVDPAATATNPLRFPGQYFDAETGTHYNYFRDYEPQTGRYLQWDPIGLDGGINTYGYVSGRPISRVDPKGLVEVYGQVGYGASVMAGLVGGSASGGVCTTGKQNCTYQTLCVRFGVGLFAGYGGEVGGGLANTGIENFGGASFSIGGDIGAGPAVGGTVSVSAPDGGAVGGAKGHGGGGVGADVGIAICYTWLQCK